MPHAEPIPLELVGYRIGQRKRQIAEMRAADPWHKATEDRHHGFDEKGIWRSQRTPPGDWTTWLLMAGRGFGKTRVGAEWVREQAMAAGKGFVIHLVGPTVDAVRDVMVEGESGILACCERYGFPAKYEPNRRRIRFGNGVIARCYSAETPNRLRGPQCHAAWSDEVAAWANPDAWDQLQFGLRLKWKGREPQQVVTTTPKPVTVVREILKLDGLMITRGSTYENAANLAKKFFETIIRKYEGTRLGRQEIEGELLGDVEGALWTLASIDKGRVPTAPERMRRVVVAVDPATTYGENADETAILAAGRGFDGDPYVLEGWHGKVAPDDWARTACLMYHRLAADAIVAESNQGGEMVRSTIQHAWKALVANGLVKGMMPRIRLIHAKRGKVIRAEDVSVLYEQGRVHHVTGELGRPGGWSLRGFEDQMVLFPVANEEQDDRVDALVHAIKELMGLDNNVLQAA